MYATPRNFGSNSGVGAYARLDIESKTMSADPHELIVLLFDGAEKQIRLARACMDNGDIPAKGRAISQAIDIVNQGLLAALDMEKGGEIARNMASIYDYITRQLLEANRANDQDALTRAEKLLTDIGSAWRQINIKKQAS